MKRELVCELDRYATKNQLCRWLNIPRSSCYYKPSGGKRGARASTHTMPGRFSKGMPWVGLALKSIGIQSFIAILLSHQQHKFGVWAIFARQDDKETS